MKIGITGHQNLINLTTVDWLKENILNELNKLIIEAAYSSLAIGADQLFATLAQHLNIPIIAVIPCLNYESTFKSNNLKIYKNLLSTAIDHVDLGFTEPSELAFFEAGKKIVQAVDTLFAVWDGKPAKGLGGTGDIVAYATALKKPIIQFNLVSKNITYKNFNIKGLTFD